MWHQNVIYFQKIPITTIYKTINLDSIYEINGREMHKNQQHLRSRGYPVVVTRRPDSDQTGNKKGPTIYGKPLKYMVAGGGIEPPTRGFSILVTAYH